MTSNLAFTTYQSQLGLAGNLPIPTTMDKDGLLMIYDIVAASKVPNYKGERIRIPSGLNLEAWKEELADFHDVQLWDFLAFGWPMSYQLPWPPRSAENNHPSAVHYPTHIESYIKKEVEAGAIIGPFKTPPFSPWSSVSPMLTRQKKGSRQRRVIIDLSWPIGTSVNDPPVISRGGISP